MTPPLVSWAEIDARKLLEIELEHDDPETLENLLEQMPDTNEVPTIEFHYDTRGAGKVRCRHCKKTAANHNRGFVLRYADGSRVLFGKDCGAKQFGEHFVHQEKQFHAARKLRDLLNRKAHIIRSRRAALDVIEQIEGYDGWSIYSRSRRSFRSGFWFVVADLVLAVERHDGRLTRIEQVRDHEAEARRSARSGRGRGALYKDVSIDIGVLAGLSFFGPGQLPVQVLPGLFQRLKSTLFSIDDKDRAHDLDLTFRGIDGIIENIEYQGDMVSDLSAALSEQNIALLMTWLNANNYGHFRHKNGIVYRHDAADQVVSVLKGDYRVPAKFEAIVPSAPVPVELFAHLRKLVRP